MDVGARDVSRIHRIAVAKADGASGVCTSAHPVHSCSKLLELAIDERRQLIQEKGQCFKCLQANQIAKVCRSTSRCEVAGCKGRHHAILHKEYVSPSMSTATCGVTAGRGHSVHHGFVPVLIRWPNRVAYTYAFIENGSDTSLIRAEPARTIGLKQQTSKMAVQSLHGSQPIECGQTSCEIQSLDGVAKLSIESAFVVNRLPVQRVDSRTDLTSLPHLRDVQVDTLDRDTVGLLLECDVPEVHKVLDQRYGGQGQPFATRSPLGWVIRGPIDRDRPDLSINAIKRTTTSHCSHHTMLTSGSLVTLRIQHRH